MKVAVICLVIFGLIAAVCAAVLVATLARPSGPAGAVVAKAEQEVDVLVATRELPPMTVVDGPAVAVKKVPKSQVPPEALLSSVQVVGKVLTDRVVEGQPFTRSCFAREGTGVYLASAVPPGKRALSITLSDYSGMAGLLYPGSVVDVLVSFKSLGGANTSGELLSTTLLQGLQVLAIGSQSIANDGYKDKEPGALATRGQVNTRMVTLLVDPKQAEILQLAMQAGSISLSMRNPLDAKQDSRRLTRAREINPAGAAPGVAVSSDEDPFSDPVEPLRAAAAANNKAPATPASAWETTIIRGKESQTRTFPLPASAGSGDTTAREGEGSHDAAPAEEPAVEAEPAGAGAGA